MASSLLSVIRYLLHPFLLYGKQTIWIGCGGGKTITLILWDVSVDGVRTKSCTIEIWLFWTNIQMVAFTEFILMRRPKLRTAFTKTPFIRMAWNRACFMRTYTIGRTTRKTQFDVQSSYNNVQCTMPMCNAARCVVMCASRYIYICLSPSSSLQIANTINAKLCTNAPEIVACAIRATPKSIQSSPIIHWHCCMRIYMVYVGVGQVHRLPPSPFRCVNGA